MAKYVVFLFDPKEDVITEPLGYYGMEEEAALEAKRLRKEEGLLAFYATEEAYRRFTRQCTGGTKEVGSRG